MLLQLPLHLLVSILNVKKYQIITININNFQSYFTLLTFIEIQLNELALVKLDKIANPMKNTFLTNLNIFIYTMLFFFIKYL